MATPMLTTMVGISQVHSKCMFVDWLVMTPILVGLEIGVCEPFLIGDDAGVGVAGDDDCVGLGVAIALR